jgi:hypothetical protein
MKSMCFLNAFCFSHLFIGSFITHTLPLQTLSGFSPRAAEVFVFLATTFGKLIAVQILHQHSNWTGRSRKDVLASEPKLKAFRLINRSKLKQFKGFYP